MTWLLIVTVLINGEPVIQHSFPMASQEECQSEIEWPGNDVHFFMTSGTGFTVECRPNLPQGTIKA
jgi:hypothetical protein